MSFSRESLRWREGGGVEGEGGKEIEESLFPKGQKPNEDLCDPPT